MCKSRNSGPQNFIQKINIPKIPGSCQIMYMMHDGTQFVKVIGRAKNKSNYEGFPNNIPNVSGKYFSKHLSFPALIGAGIRTL